jgi:hypothetical protein
MGALRDLSGKKFGRLLVTGQAGYYVQRNGTKGSLWACLCDCGNTVNVRVGKLNNGHTQSCGCLQAERRGSAQVTHRASRTAEYHTWQEIKKRCTLRSHKNFNRYGGRGIAMCARWQDSCAFLADMGPKPSPRHSIDRINNEGGYWCGSAECPECGPAGRAPNCRWATQKEQQRNRRSNRIVEINGESMCVAAWCERFGVSQKIVGTRFRNGWTPLAALTTPVRQVSNG